MDGTPWKIIIDGSSDITGGGLGVLPGGRGFPWGAEHPWGLISISAQDVTIASGEFEAGNGTILSTPQTTLSLTADAQYIGLKFDPDTGSLSLVGPTTSRPVSGDGVFQTWLYFFSFDGTSGSFVRHNLTGSWHSALFAAGTT
jgi:hypothetical protein